MLKHPNLFGNNRVFSAGLLISIVSYKNLHCRIGKASEAYCKAESSAR
jgi:hypothetical protein